MMSRLLPLALVCSLAFSDPVGPTLPWGVHLAQGTNPETEMTVMWSTRASVAASIVTLKNASGAFTASGEVYEFTDVSNTQFIHRVRLSGLAPSSSYTYTVGDGNNATSSAFSFKTPPFDHSPVVAVFGDMGVSGGCEGARG